MDPLEAQADPERPVFEAIQQGDGYALEELMRRHGRWVRGVIFAVLGRADELDDVAQRAWMQVWREARRLEDPERWRPWLYRIARNAALDAQRRRQRRRRLLKGLLSHWRKPRPSPPADAPLHLDERQRAVFEAIAELPELYREPFVLRHLEDWSYARIAETLGLPVDTVETRLVRARRQLREKLAGKV
ncbi:MAG: RNA polymerase sigma factor [Phycisphaerae bacterium]|jgi:RNA polymerase sigma-70 factor (ECF subfamily)